MWSQPPRTSEAIAAVQRLGATFYIANVEGPGDMAAFDPVAFRRAPPSLECAVCTNFGGFEESRELARPYIEQGFTMQTEAYLNENSNATPGALNVRAVRLGWPGSTTLLGVYGGQRGAAFANLAQYHDVVAPHPWGIYLLETMTEADWAELARWTA